MAGLLAMGTRIEVNTGVYKGQQGSVVYTSLDGANVLLDGDTIEKFFWMSELQQTSSIKMTELLPSAAAARKQIPVASGVLDYFPAAIAEIAKVSQVGNDQHNPGEPLHWARGKSKDQADTMMRHFLERGTLDSDGLRHSAKMCWRALAILQLELEAEGAPIARGAK